MYRKSSSPKKGRLKIPLPPFFSHYSTFSGQTTYVTENNRTTKTIELYKKHIENSGTIFLNGTVGKYEEEGFEDGTKEILDAVSKTEAYSVIGGGDALSSAEYFKINDFSFISTGGGATLNYIATEKLACFEE